MTGVQLFVVGLACTVLSAPTGSAQDRAVYRGFRLGESLTTVAARAGISAEPRVVHRRPALLQDLMWQPPVTDAAQPPDAVRKVVFSFYNDRLFRIVVDYDPRRTEGLTHADLIEALSAAYGRATLPATGFLPPSRSMSQGQGTLVVSWEDPDDAITLISASPSRYALVIVSKALDALAQVASTDAVWLDRLEAPQRDVERRQQLTQANRDHQETVRQSNRAAFRP